MYAQGLSPQAWRLLTVTRLRLPFVNLETSFQTMCLFVHVLLLLTDVLSWSVEIDALLCSVHLIMSGYYSI